MINETFTLRVVAKSCQEEVLAIFDSQQVAGLLKATTKEGQSASKKSWKIFGNINAIRGV